MFMRASLLRYGIIATAPPGITAHNALYCKPAAHEQSSFLERLYSIMRTGRGISAGRWQDRGYGYLVDPDQKYKG
jgi:hypothetical protein